MPETFQPRQERNGPAAATAVPLYALFALTGVGTALLGATLPVMLVHWHLTDASAGTLFLLLFLSSSSGSLLPRRNSAGVAAWGSAGLALACVALALTHGFAVFAGTAVFGLGLGFGISTVTRIRLLGAAAERVQEVNRLNLVWGLGAFLCPAGANEVIRHTGVRDLFMTLTIVFSAVALWTWLAARNMEQNERRVDSAPESAVATGAQPLPWIAAAAAFLAVGLESAFGGWLATYAHRLQSGFAAPVEATTLFWLGLLLSRAACSTRLVNGVSERRLLLGFVALTAAGCALVETAQRGEVVLAAALLLGVGIGPVFPLLLAAVLPRVRGNLIFVIAGIGASAIPWLTGALSGHFGSLRVGLAAPVAAGAALLVMAPKLARALERLPSAQGRFESAARQGDPPLRER